MAEPATPTPIMVEVPMAGARRRPFGVVALVIADLLIAAQSFATVLGVTEARPGSGIEFLLTYLGGLQPVFSVVLVISVISAILLWLLRPLGWYLVMLFTGLGLLFQVVAFFVGRPSYLYLIVWVASAFYLNQREVRELFLGSRQESTAVQLESDAARPR